MAKKVVDIQISYALFIYICVQKNAEPSSFKKISVMYLYIYWNRVFYVVTIFCHF